MYCDKLNSVSNERQAKSQPSYVVETQSQGGFTRFYSCEI